MIHACIYAVQALVFMRDELPHELSWFVPSISDGGLNPHRILKVIMGCMDVALLLPITFTVLSHGMIVDSFIRWDSGAD